MWEPWTLEQIVTAPAAMWVEGVRCLAGNHPLASFDLAAGRNPSRDSGDAAAVQHEVVLQTPFCRLRRFQRTVPLLPPLRPVLQDGQVSAEPRPLLVAAPISGHRAMLLEELCTVLAQDRVVYLTDWRDPREVPLDRGPFGLDESIALFHRFLRRLGPGAHLLAISQSTVPAVAVTSLMGAADDPGAPRSLSLLGGPIDVSIDPSMVEVFAASTPVEFVAQSVSETVPPGEVGEGRRVYSGTRHLLGRIAMDPLPFAFAGLGLWSAILAGDDPSAERQRRLSEEIAAAADGPAECALEMITRIFQRNELATGRFTFRGIPLRPEAVRHTALLTVEAGRDRVVGRGQTFAAHALFPAIPESRKRHHVEADADHFGLVVGPQFRRGIAPVLRKFLRESDG